MEQGAGRIEAEVFALELGRCEFWKRPRVVGFTASETPDPLRELVTRLRQLGRDCGVPVESRPFVPHLTVMRKAQREPRPELQVSLNWDVRRFVLVHSRTLPEGAQYEIIGSWELVK